MNNQLVRLQQITAAALDLALSDLQKIRQKQTQHRHAIAQLRRRKQTLEQQHVGEHLSDHIQQFQTWKRWCHREIVRHNTALAELAVESEIQEHRARLQFGRNQVAGKLATNAVDRQQRKLIRKEEALRSF